MIVAHLETSDDTVYVATIPPGAKVALGNGATEYADLAAVQSAYPGKTVMLDGEQQ